MNRRFDPGRRKVPEIGHRSRRGQAAIRRFRGEIPQSPGSSGPLAPRVRSVFGGFPRGAIQVQYEKFALADVATLLNPTKTARVESLSCDESSMLRHTDIVALHRRDKRFNTRCLVGIQQCRDVRQGKFFVLDLDGASREAAEKQIERVRERS